jgi:[ribosomal protein S5]-alanine N-acetyltransferase
MLLGEFMQRLNSTQGKIAASFRTSDQQLKEIHMPQNLASEMIKLVQIDLPNLRRLAVSEPVDFGAKVVLKDGLPPPHVASRSLAQLDAGTSLVWCIPYLIVSTSGNTIVGACGFKSAPINGSVGIGYGVARSQRGRGIATSAVRQLLQFATTEGTVQQVVAEILPENAASSQVVNRLGFSKGHTLVDPDGEIVVHWAWQVPT